MSAEDQEVVEFGGMTAGSEAFCAAGPGGGEPFTGPQEPSQTASQ